MTPEIEEHCHRILRNRRIQNRVVILCEGGTDEKEGRLSPQSFQKNDRSPDCNFYQACIPRWWRNNQKTPFFFNSGDRSKVLDTFFGLLDLHRLSPNLSYLSPNLLFALVDLDIQPKTLQSEDVYKNHSVYGSIEKIFEATYSQGKLQDNLNMNNHIFITGLVHKEAYFLLLQLQDTFKQEQAQFEGTPLNLADLYPKIANCIKMDEDLRNSQNFTRIQTRLKHYPYLNSNTLEDLQQSWLDRYRCCYDDHSDLITSLFLICKAKPYWKKLESNDSRTPEQFQDQVAIGKIAKFYKDRGDRFQPQDNKHGTSPVDHIPCLFRAIYRIAYETE